MRGPQGIPALLEKHREIHAIEEENANLTRAIELKQDRIRKLRDSRAEQEKEIRKRYNLQRPGDVTFMLPDQPKTDAPATPKPN